MSFTFKPNISSNPLGDICMTKEEARTEINTQIETAFKEGLIDGYDVRGLPDDPTTPKDEPCEFVIYLTYSMNTVKHLVRLDELLAQKYGCATKLIYDKNAIQITI